MNEIFKKSGRSRMPFTKFINYHREMYPSLQDYIPSNESLLLRLSHLITIDVTQKKKEIRLLSQNHRVPTLSENIDAPHPALKISNLDVKWTNSSQLIDDLARLFPRFGIKDIFIPGHNRVARVTLDTKKNAKDACKKLNNSWCFGRRVSVVIADENKNNHELIPSNDKNEKLNSTTVCVSIINNIITEHQITQWMKRVGKIVKVELYYLPCNKSSDFAFVHLKSIQMINDHINKLNNCRFRDNKHRLALTMPNPDYTDPTSYYKTHYSHNHSIYSNGNVHHKGV